MEYSVTGSKNRAYSLVQCGYDYDTLQKLPSIQCTTTVWTSIEQQFTEDVNTPQQIFLSFSKLGYGP